MTGGPAGEANGAVHAHHVHHHHDHAPPARSGRARGVAPRFSLLRTSVASRLGGAVAVSALIWLGVFWALN